MRSEVSGQLACASQARSGNWLVLTAGPSSGESRRTGRCVQVVLVPRFGFTMHPIEGELTVLTDPETSEKTAGGPIGKLVGKAKEATGGLSGNDDLAREGRLQQAQVDAQAQADAQTAEAEQRDAEASLQRQQAEVELERQRLQNEVSAQEREDRIERDRQEAERQAQADAQRQRASAESQRHAQESAASDSEERAERERVAAAEAAIRLEQQARRAETEAQIIDPKENQ
jgi:uncharacterized protein YjbJ (UPF0337 family)